MLHKIDFNVSKKNIGMWRTIYNSFDKLDSSTKKIVTTVIILLIVTPVITLMTANFGIHAQSGNALELENGSLVNGTGQAIIGNDPTASNGQFVQFTTLNPSPTLPVTTTPSNTPTVQPSNTPIPPPTATSIPTPTSVSGADPVILAAGDIACGTTQIGPVGGPNTSNACWQYETASLMKNIMTTVPNVQAVLALGDLQYPGSYYPDTAQYYGNSTQGWGSQQIFNITHPVPGNHDYTGYTNSNPSNLQPPAAYLNYFGSKATPNGKTYYSYNLGTWHLIALDSDCADMASNEFPASTANLVNCDQTAGSDEKSWLQQDLAQYGKTGTVQAHACVLAYWHHPIYTNWFDLTTFDDKWMLWAWQSLYASHADLILNGHAHMYERFQPVNPSSTSDSPPVDLVNGIPEIISGTGGRNLDPYHWPATNNGGVAPNTVVRNNNTMGVVQLTLHLKSVDFKFVPAPTASNGVANGTFTDSGTYNCH